MAAWLIFAGTYAVLAAGRAPLFRIDRTGAAIVGASLMVASGVLTFAESLAAVDWATIVLLLGTMIVSANLRLSGFFRWVAARAMRIAHRPRFLLAVIIGVTGLFSALLVNDTMCLVMTPLVLEITLALRRNPVPYLLGVAMASNCGSVATLTGNPQNMIVGSLSGIPYKTFAGALAPVAAASLVLTWLVLFYAYRREWNYEYIQVDKEVPARLNKPLMWKSLLVSLAMMTAFFVGVPVAQAAIVAGAALLVTRRVKPEKVYHYIDWSLLAMFAGLFVVVAGVEKTEAMRTAAQWAAGGGLNRVEVLTGLSAVLSNLVSNVPAVLVFRPFIAELADPETGWLTLAMSSTLAGNLTIVASVANLIVAEKSRREVTVSFWEYFRVGAPLTLMTLALGAAWLWVSR